MSANGAGNDDTRDSGEADAKSAGSKLRKSGAIGLGAAAVASAVLMIATFALAISPTSYYGGGGYGGGGGGGGGSTPPAATATVSDNGTVTCIADGLKPGSTAQCSIASTPTVLGTITANAQGHAQGTFPLPPGIEAGTHTVTITGIDANGNAVTITTTVTVSAAAAAAASANAGSGTTGTSTSGGAVTASPTVTG